MHSGLMYVLYIIIKTKMDAVNKKKVFKKKSNKSIEIDSKSLYI